MSNETVSDKKKTEPVALPTGALTRIPVSHIYWAETIDLPGGHGQVSNTACVPPKHDHDRYFVCVFIPAWGVLELTYIAGAGSVPVVTMLPIAHARRFVV